MSVYRTIGPTLVVKFYDVFSNNDRKTHFCLTISSYSLGLRQNGTNSQHVVESVPYNMCLIVKKPVFRVSDQFRHKPGCKSTEYVLMLEVSDLRRRGIVLFV